MYNNVYWNQIAIGSQQLRCIGADDRCSLRVRRVPMQAHSLRNALSLLLVILGAMTQR